MDRRTGFEPVSLKSGCPMIRRDNFPSLSVLTEGVSSLTRRPPDQKERLPDFSESLSSFSRVGRTSASVHVRHHAPPFGARSDPTQIIDISQTPSMDGPTIPLPLGSQTISPFRTTTTWLQPRDDFPSNIMGTSGLCREVHVITCSNDAAPSYATVAQARPRSFSHAACKAAQPPASLSQKCGTSEGCRSRITATQVRWQSPYLPLAGSCCISC